MIQAFAADLVVVLHASFILFAMFGGLAVLRWRGVAWLHLPALAWASGITIVGGICPLTPLENQLREAAGDGYAGGFIEHYIIPLIYPPGLTHAAQLVAAAVLLGLNGAIYWRFWYVRRRKAPAI